MLKASDGKSLIKLAREVVSAKLNKKKADISISEKYDSPQGVFVTIKILGKLRGCIGFPLPIYPLGKAVVKAAESAAFFDPRFPPLSLGEYDKAEFELSVLSVPEKIDVKDSKEYLSKIKVGRDGLIVKKGHFSGLLLPKVAPEWGWNELEFLENTCRKAGLYNNAWRDLDTEISSFQAQVFTEKNGRVVEEK